MCINTSTNSTEALCKQLCAKCPVIFECCPDPCSEIATARSLSTSNLLDIYNRHVGDLTGVMAELRKYEENHNG